MNCPKCGSEQLSVIDSIPDEEKSVKRRRKCNSCRYRFNTIEIEADEYESLKDSAAYLKKLMAIAKEL